MATDSLIGYATKTLSDPAGFADSAIGYATKTLVPPTHPMAFWDGGQWVWTPIVIWDGAEYV